MIIVPEKEISALLSRQDAFDAVKKVFASMSNGSAYNFPVIREAIGYSDALYGFKSGFDKAELILGLKSGGYWPGNMAKGLTNHQSAIFLFDPDTGMLRAVVGGNVITALRTAAAAAVSVSYLACEDARVLGIVGAGHQAKFQLRAVLEQRNFERIVAWNRSSEKLGELAIIAEEFKLPFEAVSLPELGAQSDVIVTITSSFEALLLDSHVQPGTHVVCMGTDTKGKREVESALVERATVFTDEIAQSISIGETQHAIASGLISEKEITPIGDVITRKHPGRRSNDEITLFDGTGVGLQDLAVASAAVNLAVAHNKSQDVEF